MAVMVMAGSHVEPASVHTPAMSARSPSPSCPGTWLSTILGLPVAESSSFSVTTSLLPCWTTSSTLPAATRERKASEPPL